MYHLPHYKEQDRQRIKEFIIAHPFAMLVGCSDKMPVATQVPFLIEEKEGELFLKGHIMKGTDHHKAFLQNKNALCVFTGPHTYVSARWYTEPKTASTWNYMSVHARGVLEFKNEDWLLDLLEKTTTHFENDKDSPASYQNLSPEYVEKLAKAIEGFEIKVTALDGIFKLSQNRDKESYQNIIEHLEQQEGGQKIAEQMKYRETTLFSGKSKNGEL